jgi:hypothetical protein
MIGSLERATWEVDRRYDGMDMPSDMGILYDAAIVAIESYESNRRRPPKFKIWPVYYNLVKKLEETS